MTKKNIKGTENWGGNTPVRYFYIVPLLIVSLTVPAYFVPALRDRCERYINHYISGYEEVGCVENVGVLFKKDRESDTMYRKIVNASQTLRTKLGPPVFHGKIKINYDGRLPSYEGQMAVGLLWPDTRTVAFVNEDVSTRLVCHELTHALYMSRSFIQNHPMLAVEGIAEAVACEASNEGIPFLNPDFHDYYLSGLSGLIDPDEQLPDHPALKNACYSIAALYFNRLERMDASLFTRLLYENPSKKKTWAEFTQMLVDHSAHPAKVRNFIQRCTVFSPISQHVFALPLEKKVGYVFSVLLFVDRLMPVEQRTLLVEIKYQLGSRSVHDTQFLTFYRGVAELHLDCKGFNRPGHLSMKVNIDGKDLETQITPK